MEKMQGVCIMRTAIDLSLDEETPEVTLPRKEADRRTPSKKKRKQHEEVESTPPKKTKTLRDAKFSRFLDNQPNKRQRNGSCTFDRHECKLLLKMTHWRDESIQKCGEHTAPDGAIGTIIHGPDGTKHHYLYGDERCYKCVHTTEVPS